MKILAIDTSNQPLSVAVLEDGNLLSQATCTKTKNHSVKLLPLIERLMEDARLKPCELDRIVVAKGPGSYTGLRIGVATAKTLAYTLDKELAGVSSLEVLAAAFPKTEKAFLYRCLTQGAATSSPGLTAMMKTVFCKRSCPIDILLLLICVKNLLHKT